MARSTDAQKAERLNAAHRLLARGQSVGEAALSLSRQFAMSRRQAYRYIEEAQLIGRPVPVVVHRQGRSIPGCVSTDASAAWKLK